MNWIRVTHRQRCPVCGKPDWCSYKGQHVAPIVVKCMRIPSEKPAPKGGWLHGGDRGPERAHVPQPAPADNKLSLGHCVRLQRKYVEAVDHHEVWKFSQKLGVSVDSLRELGIGWDRGWTFPMHNSGGEITGFRVRTKDRKFCIKGSKLGIMLPQKLSRDVLLITEGESDCAAVLTLGFSAIAIPGAGLMTHTACRVVRQQQPAIAVVIGDNDESHTVGQDAAIALTTELSKHCDDARLVFPPAAIKDVRQWLSQGCTTQLLQRAINAKHPFRRRRRG